MRSWGSWVSEIRIPHSSEKIWLGSYATAEQAARAHDAATLFLHGPSQAAFLNFSDSTDLLMDQLAAHENGLASPRTIQSTAAAFANAAAGADARTTEMQRSSSVTAADHDNQRLNSEISREGCSQSVGYGQDYSSLESPTKNESSPPSSITTNNNSPSSITTNNNSVIDTLQFLRELDLEQTCNTIFDNFLPFEGLAREGFTATSAVVTTLARFDTDSRPCTYSFLWSYPDS